MEDDYRHKGLRHRMLEVLRQKGIQAQNILTALDHVPRHLFIDSTFSELAYEDKALPIENGQTISQPYTVAYQTALLNIEAGNKILEIGTGSGYQAAIIAVLGAKVHTIERIENLYNSATKRLQELGLGEHINTYLGDGQLGLPDIAPFDGIIITAATPQLPHALLEQLKIGGVLVAPINEKDDENLQCMLRIQRISTLEYSEERFDYFRFVPLLSGVQK